MADITNSGCLILWGYNPSIARLTHATIIIEALKRGLRLIVVDPRHAGLANKADLWLRVRPGTDGALALGLANLMIQRNWYDRDFLRDWSNGPLLVRADTGRLLTERDLSARGSTQRYFAWDTASGGLVLYDPATGRYERNGANVALEGEYRIATMQGEVLCQPVFELYATLCRRYSPDVVEEICWIRAEQVEQAAQMIWHSRPVSYYAWSGHEQHTNTTQTARAISILYALTGCFDAPGGNVLFPSVPVNSITGEDLPTRSAACPCTRFGRTAARTRPLEQQHQPRHLPRYLGAAALPGTRAGRLRGKSSAGACGRSPWARSAGGAGILCACRLIHESDGRDGRCRSAGRVTIRARSAQDRLRHQSRSAVAGPVATASRSAVR